MLESYKIEFNDNIPKGFLTGFIDLVFYFENQYYILDWKSNTIGNIQSDYTPDNINLEMKKHQYQLQYLIYTVALNKYLKTRIPDYDYNQHFGGVLYLFLRGIDKTISGSGVYFDKPDKKLIQKLSNIFK